MTYNKRARERYGGGDIGRREGDTARCAEPHVCKPALSFGVAMQHKLELLLRHVDEVWRGVIARPRNFISARTAEDPNGAFCGPNINR